MSETLSDVVTIFDGPHATPARKAEGKYFLNIACLNDGRLDLAAADRVSDDDFRVWTRRVTPLAGDLLFSYETRLGEAALMPEGIDACLGRRMALLRPKPGRVHPRFLLYYFLSPRFQRLIEMNTIHGATVNRIGLASMGQWPVELPRRETQQAVAEVLGALDDKIAVNANVVAASESLMSTAYSKLAYSGHLVPLSTTASFINGKAFTKGASDTGRLVVRIAEMNSGISNSSVYSDAIVDEEYLARPGSILFAWSGSLSVHRWFREEAIVNQHIFNVLPNPGYPNWLVFQMLQSKMASFRAIAADKATTMGHIQRHHLEALVSLPAHEQLASCDALMAASWSKALLSERESLALVALRDTLLPALMSGKLRVRDAEKAVEEVL